MPAAVHAADDSKFVIGSRRTPRVLCPAPNSSSAIVSATLPVSTGLRPSLRRDCHFAVNPSPCLLKRLLKREERGCSVAEWQSRRWLLRPQPGTPSGSNAGSATRLFAQAASASLSAQARSGLGSDMTRTVILDIPPSAAVPPRASTAGWGETREKVCQCQQHTCMTDAKFSGSGAGW